MENINYFDVVVLALVFMLGLKGLLRGFVKEAFALVGLVVGVYFASGYAKEVGELISTNLIPMNGENTITLVGFVVTLIIIWVIAYFVGMIVSKMFNASGLGFFDRVLGFAFGAGKVFFIFAIIIYALSTVKLISTKLNEITKDSIVYPILKQAGEAIIQIDPVKVQEKITKDIDDVVQKTKDTVDSFKKDTNTSK